MTDTGHLRVESVNRLGAPETVFYRGPLVPTPLSRDPNGPYHSADQARRVAPDVGAEDVSYACAFEVGRLLAAADARLAQELMRWRRGAYLRSAKVDSSMMMSKFLGIAEMVDNHLPLATYFATKTIGRMAKGCGPLADPSELVKLAGAPGFNMDLVRQAFALETMDHAQALLGLGNSLLGSSVEAPPLALGEIRGFKTRFYLYTVPGQVFYDASRKLILKGVDGVVFVADSQVARMEANEESLENLRTNLAEQGYSLDKIPFVIQYNKRDMQDVATLEELRALLNPAGVPDFEGCARTGVGVFDTLKAVAKLVLTELKKGGPQ